MAKKKKSPGALLKEETRQLPHALDDTETLAAGQDLAGVIQDVEAEVARQIQIKADLKAQLTALQARRSAVALKVARREEIRDTAVEIRLDRKEVFAVRVDTGEELERRPAREHELQLQLPGASL